MLTDHNLEALPTEEGGVDGEEFYLYLNTSDHEKTCGRGGRRSNYFNYKEHRMAPPDAGSNIDVSLWRLIVIGIQSENAKVEKFIVGGGLLGVMFVFLPVLVLSSTLPDDATMADHPVQVAVFSVLAVVVLLSMIVGVPYSCRVKNKGYQKVVSSMAHRFQAQGFEIELVVHYDCCIIASPYIRFTPTRTGRQVGPTRQDGQTDDNLGVFDIHDWKPLEGKWETTETEPAWKSWLMIRLKWTLEFQIIESRSGQNQAMQEDDEAPNERSGDSLTIDDTHLSFVSKAKIHVRFLWVKTERSLTGKTTGNTHVMKAANGNSEEEGTKITPIQTGGNASCYRWGDSHVLIVQGSKMLQIDFSYEELPPASRLLSDASLFTDGREWTEFQKTEFGGSVTGIELPEIA